MNIMKKRISLFLAIVMLLCTVLTACGGDDAAMGKKLDNKFLVKDGQSDYVVVLPSQPMPKETFASEELVLFMEQATGYTFQVVTEDAVPSGKKYISLGNTSQFQAAFGDKETEELEGTFSAYFIGSKDDNIYIASSDDYNGYGVLYGVYDLLHDLIGYTYYHNSEIALTKSNTVNLWSYEKHIETADFDMRTHSTAYIYTFPEDLHGIRLRYINFSRGDEWDPTTIGHSQVPMFISPIDEFDDGSTYAEVHPEWFVDPTATTVTKSNNQLCWTAGGDAASLDKMQNIIAEKMLEYVQLNDVAIFFMLGQMDTEYVCNCDSCVAAMKEWGGTSNGLQIAFVNTIIEKTEKLLDEAEPDREVLYAIYAYKPTEAPPVKTNSDGEYEPYSDKVIPHEKLRIFFAPVRMNYGHSITSSHNADVYTNLQGWDAVCDKEQLIAYVYDLNVRYYFANWYNYRTLASLYTELRNAGVTYLLSQGVSDSNTICFDELRAYVISRLMWDTELSFDELVSDFINNYYKDAAEPMQELFELIDDRYAYYAAVVDPGVGTPDGVVYTTELWTKGMIEQMDRCIMESMDAIAHLEESDPEQYELLKARIMKEYLSNIYLKVVLYKDSYTDSEIAEMKQIWDEYIAYWNITKGGEGYDITDIFS